MGNEEKAKRYDEAIDKVAYFIKKHIGFGCMIHPNSSEAKELFNIFPELKESEDEKIRKEIISALKYANHKGVYDKHLAWLEKQGEFYTKKDVDDAYLEGMVCAKNELEKQDEQTKKMKKEIAEFIFMSKGDVKHRHDWIKCLGYDVKFFEDDKQYEQKPVDKVRPKFKNGQWIVWQDKCYKVNYNGCGYELVDQNGLSTSLEYGIVDENAHIWDITKDARVGDVLVASDGSIFLFRGVDDSACKYYAALTADNYIKINKEAKGGYWETSRAVYPATKEQCNLLFAKMKEVGYDWDAEKKEPKKIEQMSSWSEEDKNFMYDTLSNLTELKDRYGEGYGNVGKCIGWLKTLKERYTWKPSDEQLDALQYVYRNIIPPLSDELGWNSLKTLELMYHDLKKLRKE